MVVNNNVANKLAKDPLAQNGKETKNGKPAEQKAETGKSPETEKEQEQKTLPTIVATMLERNVLTIQARLKKLEALNQLLERRILLVDALDDVNTFVLVPNAPALIRFTDSKNQTFSISNPLVIGDMLELAKKRLESEIEKVDSQIIF